MALGALAIIKSYGTTVKGTNISDAKWPSCWPLSQLLRHLPELPSSRMALTIRLVTFGIVMAQAIPETQTVI